jgi:hypothetical protein
MKIKAIALAIIAILVISGILIAVDAGRRNSGPKPGTNFNGPHYNLNLIGKKKAMPGDYDNPNRHTIFVPLNTSGFNIDLNQDNNLPGNPATLPGVKIEMTQGSEFAVIDGDATDGLANLTIGPGRYNVYIVAKAKSPKFKDAYTNITGWVESYDNNGDLWYYIDIGSVNIKKNKGWVDATDLFFVTTTEDTFNFLTGSEINYYSQLGMWVFEYMSGLDSWTAGGYDLSDLAYFWQFDNHGNKLIQVRFYEM